MIQINKVHSKGMVKDVFHTTLDARLWTMTNDDIHLDEVRNEEIERLSPDWLGGDT